MKKLLAYLKARAHEFSSVIAASGAAGVVVAYAMHQVSLKQAVVGVIVAVVGYLYPEAKPELQAAAKKIAPMLLLAVAFSLGLSACASNGLTPTQNTVLTACNTYSNALNSLTALKAAGKLSTAQIASVNKAISLVSPMCENPAVPQNETVPAAMQQAITALNAVVAQGGK